MNPSPQDRNQVKEDEIDLGKVFEKIGSFFLNVLIIFLKNVKAILGFILAGIAVAVGFYFLQKPAFITEMTLSSKFLNNNYCSELINNLNKLVEDENYNQIGHLLHLDKDLASSLTKVEYKNFHKKFEDDDFDTILLKVPFKVSVSVDNNKILDTLGVSLASYLANNEYAKKRENIETENLRNQIEKLALQRASMDTLKKAVVRNMAPRESRAFVYGEPYEPLNIYKEELVFFNKELELRKELVESESVEIIQNFTTYKNPKRPIRFREAFFFGILMGFCVGVAFILLKELRVVLRNYELRAKTSTTTS